jgi:hypothetical protein
MSAWPPPNTMMDPAPMKMRANVPMNSAMSLRPKSFTIAAFLAASMLLGASIQASIGLPVNTHSQFFSTWAGEFDPLLHR